jgi:general stress protein 26
MKKNHYLFFLFKKASLILSLILTFTYINVIAQEKSPAANRDSVISAAREIINHVKYCALVTINTEGTANVRTMNPFPPEDDMCVWMATNTDTRKYDELKKNPKVSLYYANHASAEGYVTITGKAELVKDSIEIQKRKREYWKQSFPDMNKLVLIKIIPERMEVVNYKRKMYGAEVNWLAPFIEFKK